MTSSPAVPRGHGPLRSSLLTLAATCATLVLLQVVLLASMPDQVGILYAIPVLAVVSTGAGLVAWQRRPRNRVGLILVVGGLAYLLSGFGNTGVPALELLSAAFATMPLALTIHLLLAFPSGRLLRRAALATVLVAYANSALLEAPSYLFADPPAGLLGARPELVAQAHTAQRIIGIGIVVAAAAILTLRLRHATVRQRRFLAPLALYGIVTVLSIPLSNYLPLLFGVDRYAVLLVQIVALAGIPVAFVLSLLRGGFERTGDIDDLARWLASGPDAGDRPRMSQALAAALGDPSLSVRFEADPPMLEQQPEERDGLVDVELDGRRVAQIAYDPTLIADRQQVEAAGRVVALALDRERLTDELIERSTDLQLSRVRLVETQDHERRRIARDLHDGLQSQLVLLSWRADRAAKESDVHQLRAAARQMHTDLDQLARDTRSLVHGLIPALLTEQGLYAAVEDLGDGLPVPVTLHREGGDDRLPGVVETTLYFVVAESLTNVVKHAQARSVEVCLRRGGGTFTARITDDGVGGAALGRGRGLRGLHDRVEAIGGSLRLDSPPGAGTRLDVEVPCAP